MFKEERTETAFQWSMLGDVAQGRPNLGPTMEVSTYRLMQFTLRDVLIRDFGVAVADRIFFDAGKSAGMHFYQNVITKRAGLNDFLSDLPAQLKQMRIGILRMEKADGLNFTLTVAEDLDCSGLPVTAEEVCIYDEGFIAGLLFAHTNQEFSVKEVDCWASGDRVCRFEAKPVK